MQSTLSENDTFIILEIIPVDARTIGNGRACLVFPQSDLRFMQVQPIYRLSEVISITTCSSFAPISHSLEMTI
jgi:hypothetical protein